MKLFKKKKHKVMYTNIYKTKLGKVFNGGLYEKKSDCDNSTMKEDITVYKNLKIKIPI